MFCENRVEMSYDELRVTYFQGAKYVVLEHTQISSIEKLEILSMACVIITQFV